MAWIKTRLGRPWTKTILATLGWTALNAAAALSGIFQGVLVPQRTFGGGGGLVVSSLSIRLDSSPGGSLFQGLSDQLEIGQFLTLFNGRLIFFLEFLAISVAASFVISDFGRALISFLFSYVLGGFLVCFVLILPGVLGTSAFLNLLIGVMVFFTFTIFFPFPLFLGFFGTLFGVVLAERFS